MALLARGTLYYLQVYFLSSCDVGSHCRFCLQSHHFVVSRESSATGVGFFSGTTLLCGRGVGLLVVWHCYVEEGSVISDLALLCRRKFSSELPTQSKSCI